MHYQQRDEFKVGCDHFDAGEYFEAHEVWEDLWNEVTGEEHSFLQGLIQVAVALHHAGNGNFKGTHKLFSTAFGHLTKGQNAKGRVDMEALLDRIFEFDALAQKALAGEAVTDLPFFKLPLV